MHMKDGQHVQQDVVAAPAPELVQDLRVRSQIAMREHGALAATRRARGIQNGGQVVRPAVRSEEHTSELQSRPHLVCRLLLEKKKKSKKRKKKNKKIKKAKKKTERKKRKKKKKKY